MVGYRWGYPAPSQAPGAGELFALTEGDDEPMAEEIRAEMVANVWKVVASVGARVADGDTLVILESMKMEIPVLAESDGTVTQLAVNEGDVVQGGDLIATIE
jgi:biotin carboxyl carrier protein